MANAWPVEPADTACAARCTEARLLRGRGTCTAGGRRQAASGKRQAASGRRQAIVLTAINLNPVRMDQHPRGAPACFEQAIEESLETAPARVHRTNGLARHAAFVRNTCCGPARLLLVDDHNLFRTPEDHTTVVGP